MGRGPGIRIHIGLEDPQDLMADLARGFEVDHRVDSFFRGRIQHHAEEAAGAGEVALPDRGAGS
jgi:hypothetical protein